MLEEFLGRAVTAPIYAKGWVDLMIDVDRDKNGKAVNERYKQGRSGGLPWTVIVGPDGEELLTSNAQTGDANDGKNVGGPVSAWECAWFVEMLRRTKGDKVTEPEVLQVAADLEAYAAPRRRR
ncbi:MAG: hypothetical protein ACON4Z_14580 [Planctomycetota bacterium]